MIVQVGKFEFDQNSKEFKKFKKEIPVIIANEAVNHFKEGFTKENQGRRTDKSKDGWADRRSKVRDYRPVLVDTGKLKNGIHQSKETFDTIIITTSSATLDYGYKHNLGVEGQIQREFIGDSHDLMDKNFKTIEKELEKIFK